MSQKIFENVAILGLGLIGSSLAHGLRDKGLAARVVGYDASEDVRTRAEALAFCDEVAATPEEAVRDADLVIQSMPVGATGEAAKAIAGGPQAECLFHFGTNVAGFHITENGEHGVVGHGEALVEMGEVVGGQCVER